jgi:Ca2+-binding RTX toxin-like protein
MLIQGTPGNDQLVSTSENDTLQGGAGDDTYIIKNDQLATYIGPLGYGGELPLYGTGVDTIVELKDQGTDTLESNQLSVALPDNVENLKLTMATPNGRGVIQGVGNDLDNVISAAIQDPYATVYFNCDLQGGAGNDVLVGRIYQDTLDGGVGVDTMIGGWSDDTYLVDNPGDVVVELQYGNDPYGQSLDAVIASSDYVLPANVENLTLIGSAAHGVGNGGGNVLNAASVNALLEGKAGYDTLQGGAGNDTLVGGTERDLYLVSGGQDLIVDPDASAIVRVDLDAANGELKLSRQGSDLLIGQVTSLGAQSAVTTVQSYFDAKPMATEAIDVQFQYHRQFDVGVYTSDPYSVDVARNLLLSDGNDVVDAMGLGVLYTQGGDDVIFNAGTVVYAGAGQDAIYGNGSAALFSGGDGDDLLVGAAHLLGGSGNDSIIITGNTGLADGGSGNNQYEVQECSSYVTIQATGPSTNHVKFIGADANKPATASEVEISGPGDTYINLHQKGSWSRIRINFEAGQSWEVEFANGEVWRQADFTGKVNLTSDGNDIVDGTNGDDLFDGGLGDDQISGGLGNDSVKGGAGRDVIFGGQGDDVLDGGADGDVLAGEGGNDLVMGGAGDDDVFGGAGDDTIIGGAGEDDLGGGAGDDVFVIGRNDGNDAIFGYNEVYTRADPTGLDGHDVLKFIDGIRPSEVRFDTQSLSLLYTGGNVRVSDLFDLFGSGQTTGLIEEVVFDDGTRWQAAQLSEQLRLGTDGKDGLWALSAGTWLDGGLNDDVLHGRQGRDTLLGGEGQDTLTGDDANDILRGGGGDDYLDGGDGYDTLEGGDGRDTLIAGAGGGDLDGGAGDDLLSSDDFGTAGLRLFGGDGNDIVSGGWGRDTLSGGVGRDVLTGGVGADQYLFAKGDGQDTIHADTQDAIIVQGAVTRSDLIIGKLGATAANTVVLSFKNSTDSITLDNAGQWAGLRLSFESEGSSLTGADILAEATKPVEPPKPPNLTLNGTAGKDNLTGGAGNDTLTGLAGNDTLAGGLGADKLIGGKGNDTYLFNRGDGKDTIVDTDGTWLNADFLKVGNAKSNQLWLTKSGNNLDIAIIGAQDHVVIQDWYLSSNNRVEKITALGDNKSLSASKVNALVTAMAKFSAPADGLTTLPASTQTALTKILASSWA